MSLEEKVVRMRVVEQQLGEKPPRTSTCSEEENPRPAVPHI